MVSELLDNKGKRYATPEAAAQATARNQAADAERAAREQADADAWERRHHQAYMAVPGATEQGWEAANAGILAEARKRAALSADDAERAAVSRRYALG